DGRVHAGSEIHHGHADAHGLALRLAVEAHEPCHRLHHRIVAGIPAQWAVGAKTGDTAMNEPREAPLQHGLISHVPALERAYLEILHEDVRALQKAEHGLAPCGPRKIECHSTLVPIDADEIGGRVALKRRTPGPGLIALRWLDLDHVGAMVGEHLRAIGATQHASEVDHLDAGECAGALIRGHGASVIHSAAHGTIPKTRAPNWG